MKKLHQYNQSIGTFQKLRFVGGRNQRGFALIATISILVLLALISVGLLSLSTITVRSSKGGGEMQIARANARLGMMVALNQLQAAVGPDQRVTALADLKNPTAANPRWVGVYGNEEVADYEHKPSEIPSQPYEPVLLNWLVSGNQEVSFSSSTTNGSFGKITAPPASIPFSPTDAVSLSDSPTVGSQKAALLVSGGSTNDMSDYVAAPIVPVSESSGNVRGGYAYWTGDEGVKARVDLRDNFRQQTIASKIKEGKAYSFVTSQRSGIEMMDNGVRGRTEIGADYDPNSADIKKLITTGQLPLLSAGLESSDIHRTLFHDATAHSKSVIADSYAGGLKKDMSAAIYGNSGPADDEPIFVPESSGEFGLPSWGHLRTWANNTAPLSTPPPNGSSPQPYTSTQSRFGPVISMASLGIGIQENRRMPGEVRVQLYPALILWNPYTVGIPAADYEVGFRFNPSSSVNDLIEVEAKTSTEPRAGFSSVGSFNLSGGGTGMVAGNGYFRFNVKGSVIPAGESHVYLADNAGTMYVPGGSAMVRAPDNAPIGYNTRYFITDRSFNIAGANANTEIKFLSSFGSAQSMGNGDRREVILTEPGGLAGGFSESTPVYQALLDMNTYRRFFPPAEPQKLATLGTQPAFVFRTQLMMESRGGFSADWRKIGAMHQSGANRGQERNRWLANHNPLAPYIKRTKTEQGLNNGAFSHGSIVSGDPAERNTVMLGVTRITNYLAGVGGSQDSGTDAPLLDVLPSSSMLLSLGQFQHAQLDAYGFGTTYTFGNAGANVSIPRNQHFVSSHVARPGENPTDYEDPLYDISWHTNRALWDQYFVSTASASLSQADIDESLPLPNARMIYHKPNGERPDIANLKPTSSAAIEEAAANLMVAGGFNINSTSVNAWRAMLTGTNQLNVHDELANPLYSSKPMSAMMPRFSRDVRKSDGSDADGLLNMWDSSGKQRYNVYRGNRELLLYREQGKGNETPEDAQKRLSIVANSLATKIVEEIRLRGPFLSLGDFVNRKLVDTRDSEAENGIRGTLQAAIDKTNRSGVNPKTSFIQIGAFVNAAGNNKTVSAWDAEHYMGTPSNEGSSSNSRTATAPKHLTQADVLSTLGPALSARSDTFVIRSYGESINPITKDVTARAWCEAVVQRTPDYVDSADEASKAPEELTKQVNKILGRRFEIVSFRWLSKDEI